jgi:tocopherol O-methyltransferase
VPWRFKKRANPVNSKVENDIVRYYDQTESDYRLVWGLGKNLSIHYGYWDKTTKTFAQALQNTNRILAQKAAITSQDRVLDAGCGVGGSSIWLADNIGCRVHGIALPQRQIDMAAQNAARAGVSDLVEFTRTSYLDSGFPDACFSVVWAVESVCYAVEKRDFLVEARRQLAPGGRLIMSDFFRTKEDLSRQELVHYRGWADGWALEDFEVIGDFEEKLGAVGFRNVVIEDATPNITPLARRMYVAFFPGYLVRRLQWLVRAKSVVQEKNLWSAYHQWRSLKQGVWAYKIVRAEK